MACISISHGRAADQSFAPEGPDAVGDSGVGAAGAVVAAGRSFAAGCLFAGGSGTSDVGAAAVCGGCAGRAVAGGIAAFAAPGGFVPVPGSGVMMLTAGVLAALGNSALVGRPVGKDGGSPASAPVDAVVMGGAFHNGA